MLRAFRDDGGVVRIFWDDCGALRAFRDDGTVARRSSLKNITIDFKTRVFGDWYTRRTRYRSIQISISF
jgi:hypothetical protein